MSRTSRPAGCTWPPQAVGVVWVLYEGESRSVGRCAPAARWCGLARRDPAVQTGGQEDCTMHERNADKRPVIDIRIGGLGGGLSVVVGCDLVEVILDQARRAAG